ncbi:MerR family transcriptional regulator (plasmid) [Embleya sp. NBC_00888]|uniref:MerR family transcriptional regulator n=1 Tax=Embleya sp. NBC_00888 TaxID=2975960 RepID=UPI002F90840F|nr:MerR family transcriptional regulator [Embleya sp. NBC_00888]
MRIGDAAAAAGLTPRALRYYEQEGLLRAGRSASGHREYEVEDVHRLSAVRRLLEAGLTIGDLKDFIDVLDMVFPLHGEPPGPGPRVRAGDCPVAEVAVRRLAELDARIARLTEARTRLADALAHRFGDMFPVGSPNRAA